MRVSYLNDTSKTVVDVYHRKTRVGSQVAFVMTRRKRIVINLYRII